jgi:hypothetical protein
MFNPVYEVPERVRQAAQRGLWIRSARSRTTRRPGGTEVGVKRARQLVSGTIDLAGIRRMKAFFDRFRRLKKHPDWGSPMMPGYVAWLLWGGNPGDAWARRISQES